MCSFLNYSYEKYPKIIYKIFLFSKEKTISVAGDFSNEKNRKC